MKQNKQYKYIQFTQSILVKGSEVFVKEGIQLEV